MAYVVEENGFPVAPAVLGIVLGPLLEDRFTASMIKSDGEQLGFVSRPIAAVLAVATLTLRVLPPLIQLVRARSKSAGSEGLVESSEISVVPQGAVTGFATPCRVAPNGPRGAHTLPGR